MAIADGGAPWRADAGGDGRDTVASSQSAANGRSAPDSSERGRVEAILLISKSPVSLRKLATLAGLDDATRARTLVAELNDLYDRLGRAVRIESIAGGHRLMTRPVVAPWLGRLGFLPPAVRLSWPMMETLAVVAYRQDVTRAGVEALRGVACGEILRQLMQLDLVRITGRSDDLGRPYLYGTTKRFLKICGLASINGLPPIDASPIADDVSDSDLPDPPLHASKEPDVSVVLTATIAADSLAVDSPADGWTPGIAAAPVVVPPFDVDSLETPPLDTPAADAPSDAVAAIEDEEDDLYEKGFETDDEEEGDDDFDDDWDDEDDDDDDDDDESDEDDLDEDDDDEDDEDEDEPAEEEDKDEWEEVDDADADEDWEEDDEDDEDDDWEEEADDDESWES